MRLAFASVVAVLLMAAAPAGAAPLTIDFEDLSSADLATEPWTNLQPLDSQYAALGVAFVGGSAGFSGVSLSEPEFPPHSGAVAVTNITLDVSDPNNPIPSLTPIEVILSLPYYAFSAFFTYDSPLTLEFFSGATSLGSVASNFLSNNYLGDPFAVPPFPPETFDLIQFASTNPITRVLISGNQFTLDDLTLSPDAPTQTAPVPEPGTLLLLGTGAATAYLRRRTSKQ